MDLNSRELENLQTITQAKLDLAMAELAKVAEKENACRRQLGQLDDQFEQARAPKVPSIDAMEYLGAQQLWFDWARQKRHEINMNLARIMAEKSQFTQALRHTLGQRDALNELLKNVRINEARKVSQIKQTQLLLLNPNRSL